MHHPSCPLHFWVSFSLHCLPLTSPIPCAHYWAARGTFRWLVCLFLFQFAIPVEETKYAYTFSPLPTVKQKHHICKVNFQAVLLGKKQDRTDLLLQSCIQVCLLQQFSINLGAFHLSFTAIGLSQLICLACVETSSVLFLALEDLCLYIHHTWRNLATSLMSQCSELRSCYLLVSLRAKGASRIFYIWKEFCFCSWKLLRVFV